MPRLRPGHPPDDPHVSHYVVVDANDEPVWELGWTRAICGADVAVIVKGRPIWRAGGDACQHCNRVFDQMKAEDRKAQPGDRD